jgi:hypothetical protein
VTSPPSPDGSGPHRARIRPYLQVPPPGPEPGSNPGSDSSVEPEPDAAEGAWGATTYGSVLGPSGLRPFVLTAGRVSSADPDIGLETQVTARLPGPPGTVVANLTPELRAIVTLCAYPMSVAEVSARLRLHLGVTRVLVGDLRAAGHLDVHTTDVANPHNPETILRVIRGLRAIS